MKWSLEELDVVATPPCTESWYPVPHRTVLDRVCETLTGAGFGIEAMQLSLARDDARFFGTLTLKNRLNNDATLAVGIRNSTDKSFPIGLVCGSRVFVCDNLAFDSEIINRTQAHSLRRRSDLTEAVSKAVLGLHRVPGFRTATDCPTANLGAVTARSGFAVAQVIRNGNRLVANASGRDCRLAESGARGVSATDRLVAFERLHGRAERSAEVVTARSRLANDSIAAALESSGDVIDVVSTPAIAV